MSAKRSLISFPILCVSNLDQQCQQQIDRNRALVCKHVRVCVRGNLPNYFYSPSTFFAFFSPWENVLPQDALPHSWPIYSAPQAPLPAAHRQAAARQSRQQSHCSKKREDGGWRERVQILIFFSSFFSLFPSSSFLPQHTNPTSTWSRVAELSVLDSASRLT